MEESLKHYLDSSVQTPLRKDGKSLAGRRTTAAVRSIWRFFFFTERQGLPAASDWLVFLFLDFHWLLGKQGAFET